MRKAGTSLISEDELQETIIAACQAMGRRVFHASDSRKQVRTRHGEYQMVGDELATGYPDLTIAPREAGGEAIWAELKGPKGRLEEAQVEWLDDLPGHRGFVWRSDDLDDGLAVIQRGHPGGTCRTCWTCSREEIIGRIGVRRKREGRNLPEGIPAQAGGAETGGAQTGGARGGRR